MTERDGIFAGDDPFDIFRRWMGEAAGTEPNDPNAVALATVDDTGLPNLRVVLLKEVEPEAFVFYTNYESAKGRELLASGKAALNAHWKTLQRQIRVRGRIETVEAEQADAYYASRPLESRIGAWASRQSRPLESREALLAEVERRSEEFGETPPRPPHWGGFRLIPQEMEFWAAGAFRLHDRFRWVRASHDRGWDVTRLNP